MSERIQKQIESVDEQLKGKTHKGISFVRRNGNNIEYVNIPNDPQQNFKYFYNPSKLTAEQRKEIREKGMLIKTLLLPEIQKIPVDDDL